MNAPNEPERDRLYELVKSHVNQLGEHFDTVAIFCTNSEEGGKTTLHLDHGTGNWFARYGQVEEWVRCQQARAAAKAAKAATDESND